MSVLAGLLMLLCLPLLMWLLNLFLDLLAVLWHHWPIVGGAVWLGLILRESGYLAI